MKINKWSHGLANLQMFFSITMDKAFEYLYDYKGIGFIDNFYDAEHILSMEDAVDDLRDICYKNGARL